MASELPLIQLGPHRVSRLVVGANPVLGFSYMGSMMGQVMLDYFTLDRIYDLVVRCLAAGINTWQTSWHEKIDQTLTRLRENGHEVNWILLTSGPQLSDDAALADGVRRHRPIAIVHHGGVSDRLYREGQSQQIHEFVSRVKGLSTLAGVSAHNPEVIRFVEDAGWPVDLYMTCFYQLTRTPEELQAELGQVPLWGNFLPGDPAAMCAVVREVERPCLAFKILGGGRQAETPEGAAAAFEFAFANLKPTDGVIVGMFPRFRDEPAENAALVQRFG